MDGAVSARRSLSLLLLHAGTVSKQVFSSVRRMRVALLYMFVKDKNYHECVNKYQEMISLTFIQFPLAGMNKVFLILIVKTWLFLFGYT